ncbi:MAG: response regulator [Proteobacteria bacterium]|nr:response regulator [Pseudomonadota bacterium]
MKRLLLIDNKELLEVNKELLASYLNVEVVVSDSSQAIKLSKTQSFDIIVSDFRMPKYNGLDVVAQIRENQGGKFIPAIIITGYSCMLKIPKDMQDSVLVIEKTIKITDQTASQPRGVLRP